jgi:hypothetical protein
MCQLEKYLWPGPGQRQSERVLQAFQAMIEDPSSAHDYLNDPVGSDIHHTGNPRFMS